MNSDSDSTSRHCRVAVSPADYSRSWTPMDAVTPRFAVHSSTREQRSPTLAAVAANGRRSSLARSAFRRAAAAWRERAEVSGAQQRHQRVEHPAGQQRLGAVVERLFGAVRAEQPAVVGVDLERLALADGVDHEQVAALAGEFGTRVGEHVAVLVAGLGGETDDGGAWQLPVATGLHQARQDVVVLGQRDDAGPA